MNATDFMLSDLTENMVIMLDKLRNCEGDAEALENTLESLTELADDELEAILAYMDEVKKEAEFLDKRAKEITAAAKVYSTKHDNLKAFVAEHLKATGQDAKAKRVGVYKLSFRKGVEVVKVDESKLPAEYWLQQDPKPMGKADLKKLLQNGKIIDGVSLHRNDSTLQIGN
jgi:Siphovirus Gp157.